MSTQMLKWGNLLFSSMLQVRSLISLTIDFLKKISGWDGWMPTYVVRSSLLLGLFSALFLESVSSVF